MDNLQNPIPKYIAPGIDQCSQFGSLSTGNLYGIMTGKRSEQIRLLAYRFAAGK